MAARFRIALQGFSEFERNALGFCLKHAGARVPSYVQVERIADCDFIVADASQPIMDASVLRGERLRDTLFVGDKVPPRAVAHIGRPLDPERILRALDRMVVQRIAPKRAPEPPDVVMPPPVPHLDFPLLDLRDIVEETTPAAFEHAPMDIRLRDERELDAAVKAPPAPPPAPLALPADDLAPPPGPPTAPEQPPPAPRRPPMTEEERHAAKEAARRRSRAARQAQARQDAPLVTDILLLDAKAPPDPIAFLLEAFGFRVHRVAAIDAALKVLEETPLVAAFIDLGVEEWEGVDGMELCQLVKQSRLGLAGAVPAVMLLARRRVASESVRAKLAGCDAYLAPPVRRGDVARALEGSDIALPADERRSPR